MKLRPWWSVCVAALLFWGLGGLACDPVSPGTDGGSKESSGGTEPKASEPGGKEPGAADAAPQEKAPEGTTPGDRSTPPEPRKTSLAWYGGIQPLIQDHCQRCHSNEGIAPFPLTNYQEVKAKASVVKWSVQNRVMPPWMPITQDASNACLPMKHDLSLKQDQIDAIVGWIDKGMEMGDPKLKREFKPTQDKLDAVDAQVDIQTDYTPKTTLQSPQDDFHCFMTKKVLDAPKELVGFRLIPGVKKEVHHVLIYGVSDAKARSLEKQHPQQHWPCFTGALLTGSATTGGGVTLLGVWVPGTDVVRFPKDTGMPMAAGDRLVLEIHYNMASLDKPLPDRTSIQLQYAKTPVKHKLQLHYNFQAAFAIQPKQQGAKASTTRYISRSPGERFWGIMPHMHQKGTKFKVTILKPDQSKQCMMDIQRWDYNWQQSYFFNNPNGVLLGPGHRIHTECTWDNPTDRVVRWGEGTNSEMCVVFFFLSTP